MSVSALIVVMLNLRLHTLVIYLSLVYPHIRLHTIAFTYKQIGFNMSRNKEMRGGEGDDNI